jgi:hypothetical protein
MVCKALVVAEKRKFLVERDYGLCYDCMLPPKLTGEPDTLRSFFKQLSQEFAPRDKRLLAETFPF